MLHKEQGTRPCRSHHSDGSPDPGDPCGVTEPGGETDQGIVTGLGKLAEASGWQTSMEMVSRLRSLVAEDFSSRGMHWITSPSSPTRKWALTWVSGWAK